MKRKMVSAIIWESELQVKLTDQEPSFFCAYTSSLARVLNDWRNLTLRLKFTAFFTSYVLKRKLTLSLRIGFNIGLRFKPQTFHTTRQFYNIPVDKDVSFAVCITLQYLLLRKISPHRPQFCLSIESQSKKKNQNCLFSHRVAET